MNEERQIDYFLLTFGKFVGMLHSTDVQEYLLLDRGVSQEHFDALKLAVKDVVASFYKEKS